MALYRCSSGSVGGVQIGEEPTAIGSVSLSSGNSINVTDLTVGKVYIAIISTSYSNGTANVSISSGGDTLWDIETSRTSVSSVLARNRAICFRATATTATVTLGTGAIKGTVIILDYDTNA